MLLSCVATTNARASFCSATACTQILNTSNYDGNQNFGTVSLTLSGTTVTVDVNLASGFRIITTGFPGAFGFLDNLGGGLTIGNFKTGGNPTNLYSGAASHPTDTLHWDGFGYSNDVAAINGPQRPKSLEELSFTVSKSSLADVRDLLNLFNPAGGQGPAYFVVDSCTWNGSKCVNTGLLAMDSVPEPASLMLLATSLVAFGFLHRRKAI
jgi:hypothetical protein